MLCACVPACTKQMSLPRVKKYMNDVKMPVVAAVKHGRGYAGGDSGIVKTLDQPVYMVTVIGDTVHALDRDGKTLTIQVRPAADLSTKPTC
jgi:Cu/Ag efflux protein CusF